MVVRGSGNTVLFVFLTQRGSLPVEYAGEGGYKDAIKLLESASKVGGSVQTGLGGRVGEA